jgi:polyisoprenyl-phosphate glycosyltransferase
VAPGYSFVIPVCNERETLPELQRRLLTVLEQLDEPTEVLFVDDGSTDGSFEILLSFHERDPRFKVIRLSRNFGQQAAITTGLDHALGKAVVIMDADLQDPPEVALDLARRWREGYEVVYAVRASRAGETRLKLWTAKWFYRVLGRMTEIDVPGDAGDFRLVDRRVLEAIKAMREHRRYLRGMFAWVGYNQTAVHYTRSGRYAGSSKFSLTKMARFALDGIASFSTAPLRLALNLGFAVSVLALFVGIATIVLKIAGVHVVSGWASIVVVIAFIGGVQLTVLGVIGVYIAQIHDEVKRRPLYLVSDAAGVEIQPPAAQTGSEPAEAVRAKL